MILDGLSLMEFNLNSKLNLYYLMRVLIRLIFPNGFNHLFVIIELGMDSSCMDGFPEL